MSALSRLGDWIDAFRPAEGPPPRRLGAFMNWCLSGSWPMLVLAMTWYSMRDRLGL